MDSYLTVDVLFATCAFVTQFFIVLMGPDMFKKPADKDNIDLLMTIVIALGMCRFFMLFLVVESISKMLLTLKVMVADVWPFMVIMLAYYLIGTQTFSTLYQDEQNAAWEAADYVEFFNSFRATFDATMGAYGY